MASAGFHGIERCQMFFRVRSDMCINKNNRTVLKQIRLLAQMGVFGALCFGILCFVSRMNAPVLAPTCALSEIFSCNDRENPFSDYSSRRFDSQEWLENLLCFSGNCRVIHKTFPNIPFSAAMVNSPAEARLVASMVDVSSVYLPCIWRDLYCILPKRAGPQVC